LNISGHPLSAEAAEQYANSGYSKIVDIPVENVEFSPNSVIEKAISIVKSILKKHSKLVKTNSYTVLLPGFMPLGAAIISILHGVSGSFPNISFLKRDNGIFIPAGEIDLQTLRLEARDFR